MSFLDTEASIPLLTKSLRQQEEPRAVAIGIFHINTSLLSFCRLINFLGTPKDTLHLLKTRQPIGELVKETSTELKQPTESHRNEQPTKKINDAKLAKEFRSALNEFQKAKRLAAERETIYAPFVTKQQLISEVNEIFKDLAFLVHEQGLNICKRANKILFWTNATIQTTYIEFCDVIMFGTNNLIKICNINASFI
ncbi:hypothetical protein K2173_023209 [Erythroxylum novogranatense]|uniref:Syntaxin N-terminal domain-containing protein n=1 Tax=Erythroxylum novogranatense TaxID=1862640 RepID=A0AAV8TAN5_9ROSI|nr:hypothetical protein K2173_023209 [Erythroxylum novogranatense]